MKRGQEKKRSEGRLLVIQGSGFVEKKSGAIYSIINDVNMILLKCLL
jgi:hypothetical protein